MQNVIQVDNVSKQYRLGRVGAATLSHDLKRWWYRVRGMEDPYLKMGATNKRDQKGEEGEYVWALKDVNFEVGKGEVLGIIGKNGAGKSTLLKILSRITTPSTGELRIDGRVASLLEVGTGFHAELTGKENIFLNGAILGMTKAEIKSKLDEIIEFSGVERYIDTPVKRYSSGMYVRLAFAVAAHLEPEILIIDEVLAVGDAEFQKKCLGKMKSVAGEGRTVIFVSHNMDAVKRLCTRVIHMKHGHIVEVGPSAEVVNRYLETETSNDNLVKGTERIWEKSQRPGNQNIKINRLSLKDIDGLPISKVEISKSFKVEIEYEVLHDDSRVQFSLIMMQNTQELFGSLSNTEPNFYGKPMSKGTYVSQMAVPGNTFNNGTFQIWLTGFSGNWTEPYNVENIVSFDAVDDGVLKGDYYGGYGGLFRPKLDWVTEVK